MGECFRKVVKGTVCSNELEFFNECSFRRYFHNGVKACSYGVNKERALGREFG